MSRRFTIIVLSLIVVLLTASSLSAQAPQLLTPENAEIATLSEQAPINVFSFSGSQGDLVQIRLVGIQSDMNLTASLQSPSQQNAGVSVPTLAGEGAYLSAILPETGVYTVLVGGNHGNYLTSFRVLPFGALLRVRRGTCASKRIPRRAGSAGRGFVRAGSGSCGTRTNPQGRPGRGAHRGLLRRRRSAETVRAVHRSGKRERRPGSRAGSR